MQKQWGGRRPGSGPPRKRLNLDHADTDATRDFASLMKRLRAVRNDPDLLEEAVVMELVREELKKEDYLMDPVLPHLEREFKYLTEQSPQYTEEFARFLEKRQEPVDGLRLSNMRLSTQLMKQHLDQVDGLLEMLEKREKAGE